MWLMVSRWGIVKAGVFGAERVNNGSREHEVAQVCPVMVPGLSLSDFLWTTETCSEQKWETRSRRRYSASILFLSRLVLWDMSSCREVSLTLPWPLS